MNLRILAGAVLAALLGTTAMADITYEGGDGTSVATAVHIVGAVGETDGVQSEYLWLGQHFPGYSAAGQGLLQKDGRSFDMMVIHQGDKTYEVYFDITDFFGKM